VADASWNEPPPILMIDGRSISVIPSLFRALHIAS
jgi:hypothetical protein